MRMTGFKLVWKRLLALLSIPTLQRFLRFSRNNSSQDGKALGNREQSHSLDACVRAVLCLCSSLK